MVMVIMYSIIYITTSGVLESKKIAKILLEDKLACCINIIPSIESLYLWNGKIEEDSESIMVVKTKSVLVDELIKMVENVHSYETPCILEITINNGSKNYLKWMETELP
jgi:periplasmic divalent cation tolerance protein